MSDLFQRLIPRSLKAQLTLLLFGVTAALVTALSFVSVNGLVSLGDRTETITSESMRQKVQQLLAQTVDATAEKSSVTLGGIQSAVGDTAVYLQGVFDRPNDFSRSAWQFDRHVFRRSGGQYSNASTETSSVFISSLATITPQMRLRMELSGYLDYLAPQLLKSHSDVVALYYMGGASGETRYYPNIDLASFTPADFDIPTQDFFAVATPQNDPTKETRWTKVYDDPAGNGLTISAASPLYNAGVFSGVVAMDVTLNNIAKTIESYHPIEGSYAFLIDNQGRAIALPAQGYRDLLGREQRKGEFGSDLSKTTGDMAAVLLQMRNGKQGFTQLSNQGDGLYMAYAPVKGTPFSLAIVAREAVILKVVGDLRNQVKASTWQALYGRFVPLGLVVLLVVWWLGFVIIRRINGPIQELTLKTAEVASGNLNVKPVGASVRNELGQLATSFNGMVAQLQDSRKKITEQNRQLLQNQQHRLEASINSLRVGFIMTDRSNQVILLNEAARKILMIKPREQVDMAVIDQRLGEAVGFADNLARVAKTRRTYEKKAVDYRESVLRVFMAPVLGGNRGDERLGVVALLEDITEAKLLERSRDEFFSIASHELRTPLTAIRGNASMLSQIFAPKMKDHDFNDMVGDIHSASVRLIEIVNDFLDASRLEQGRIRFESTDFAIAETVKAVVYEMATVAKDKGVKLVMGRGLARLPLVHADKNRVKQVVYNLMGNALKFTEKGNITIDARVEGSKLKVLVRDSGPGISEENQRLLFHKFQQASNGFTTRESRGTGLGLYISKLLSEQMGGRIGLEESVMGKGTTFSFTVPLAKETNGK